MKENHARWRHRSISKKHERITFGSITWWTCFMFHVCCFWMFCVCCSCGFMYYKYSVSPIRSPSSLSLLFLSSLFSSGVTGIPSGSEGIGHQCTPIGDSNACVLFDRNSKTGQKLMSFRRNQVSLNRLFLLSILHHPSLLSSLLSLSSSSIITIFITIIISIVDDHYHHPSLLSSSIITIITITISIIYHYYHHYHLSSLWSSSAPFCVYGNDDPTNVCLPKELWR